MGVSVPCCCQQSHGAADTSTGCLNAPADEVDMGEITGKSPIISALKSSSGGIKRRRNSKVAFCDHSESLPLSLQANRDMVATFERREVDVVKVKIPNRKIIDMGVMPAIADESEEYHVEDPNVRAFLKRKAFPSVNSERRGVTTRTYPLHIAVKEHDHGMVERLLLARANPYLKNDEGLTPLHMADNLNNQLGFSSGLFDKVLHVLSEHMEEEQQQIEQQQIEQHRMEQQRMEQQWGQHIGQPEQVHRERDLLSLPGVQSRSY